jgi:hypothetical protein
MLRLGYAVVAPLLRHRREPDGMIARSVFFQVRRLNQAQSSAAFVPDKRRTDPASVTPSPQARITISMCFDIC